MSMRRRPTRYFSGFGFKLSFTKSSNDISTFLFRFVAVGNPSNRLSTATVAAKRVPFALRFVGKVFEIMRETCDSVGLGLLSSPIPRGFDRVTLPGSRFVALGERWRLAAGRNARGGTAPAWAALIVLVVAPPCRWPGRRFGRVWGLGHRLHKVCRMQQHAWRG